MHHRPTQSPLHCLLQKAFITTPFTRFELERVPLALAVRKRQTQFAKGISLLQQELACCNRHRSIYLLQQTFVYALLRQTGICLLQQEFACCNRNLPLATRMCLVQHEVETRYTRAFAIHLHTNLPFAKGNYQT